jgi:hypothetical protein
MKNITFQNNSYDCGIFAIGYVEKILEIMKD